MITINAKIKLKPGLLAKQVTPSVFGGRGLWSILSVSSAKELKVYTTGVSDGSANSSGVSGGRGLNDSIKISKQGLPLGRLVLLCIPVGVAPL